MKKTHLKVFFFRILDPDLGWKYKDYANMMERCLSQKLSKGQNFLTFEIYRVSFQWNIFTLWIAEFCSGYLPHFLLIFFHRFENWFNHKLLFKGIGQIYREWKIGHKVSYQTGHLFRKEGRRWQILGMIKATPRKQWNLKCSFKDPYLDPLERPLQLLQTPVNVWCASRAPENA